MPISVKEGWITDAFGNKLSPNTTASQVMTLDDKSVEEVLEDTVYFEPETSAATDVAGLFTQIQQKNDQQDAQITELNSKMAKKAIACVVTINDTTSSSGVINITTPINFTSRPYILTNVSSDLDKPYSVTISQYLSSNSFAVRIRKMADNTAVGNTALNFNALIIGV